MNAKQFAAQMKAEIEAIKQQGTAAIFVDNLINYRTPRQQNHQWPSSNAIRLISALILRPPNTTAGVKPLG